MNYRELLKLYINHVGDIEGTSFISGSCPNGFTQEEWNTLIECDKEATREWYVTRGLQHG